MTQPVHASVVALHIGGRWRGVLIRGQSGAGKSDLALRLMSLGAKLVVDDQAIIWNSQNSLYARSPATIAGKIELRGVGIIAQPHLNMARIWLVVDAVSEPPERHPDPQFCELCGVRVASIFLQLKQASAAQVVATALQAL